MKNSNESNAVTNGIEEKETCNEQYRSLIKGNVRKLLLIVITVILIVILASRSYNMRNSSTGISSDEIIALVQLEESRINQSLIEIELLTESLGAEIASEVDVQEAILNEEYLINYTDKLTSRLQKVGKKAQITESIYVYFNVDLFGYAADVWLDSNDFERQETLPLEYYNEPRAWYDKAVRNGEIHWFFPYLSSEGKLKSSYIIPILKDDRIIGLVGMDFCLNEIHERLENITIDKNGFMYIIDRNGEIIVYPGFSLQDFYYGDTTDSLNEKLVLEDNMAIINETQKNYTGIVKYRSEEQSEMVTVFVELSNGWILRTNGIIDIE